jgi:hypothetical protein
LTKHNNKWGKIMTKETNEPKTATLMRANKFAGGIDYTLKIGHAALIISQSGNDLPTAMLSPKGFMNSSKELKHHGDIQNLSSEETQTVLAGIDNLDFLQGYENRVPRDNIIPHEQAIPELSAMAQKAKENNR